MKSTWTLMKTFICEHDLKMDGYSSGTTSKKDSIHRIQAEEEIIYLMESRCCFLLTSKWYLHVFKFFERNYKKNSFSECIISTVERSFVASFFLFCVNFTFMENSTLNTLPICWELPRMWLMKNFFFLSLCLHCQTMHFYLHTFFSLHLKNEN